MSLTFSVFILTIVAATMASPLLSGKNPVADCDSLLVDIKLLQSIGLPLLLDLKELKPIAYLRLGGDNNFDDCKDFTQEQAEEIHRRAQEARDGSSASSSSSSSSSVGGWNDQTINVNVIVDDDDEEYWD